MRLKNFAASAGLVLLACAVYRGSPVNHQQLLSYYGPPSISFRGGHFLLAAALAYCGLLALFFLSERRPGVSKALRAVHWLIDFARTPRATLARGLTDEQRLALLSSLLKGFFGPMMVVAMMDFCMSALVNGLAIAASGGLAAGNFAHFFDRFGFWFLMQLIFFVDVLVFTVGYLVELPQLGNPIRSVETTLLGWGAALACYPPFNQLTAALLGSYRSDFPKFDDPTLHLALNLLLLALMAVYASASVALGLKASNLTHRGIVRSGPYALVRHPAYTCKNLAWWIASAPLVAGAFGQSWVEGLQAVGSVAGWSLIYVLRALTEEDHLRRVDGDYGRYAQQVPRRFLPGLI